MKKLMIALAGLTAAVMASSVAAKLPPPSEEAKAKAEETKAKAAWADKVAAYKLCQAQDKVAAQYRKNKGAQAKAEPAAAAAPSPASTAAPAAQGGQQATAAPTSVSIPPCQDPGPYVAAAQATAQVGVADAKPVPAAGKPPAPAESNQPAAPANQPPAAPAEAKK